MEKDTRTRLIEAGLTLFSAKGYAAVSIRELAAEAEVNSALINYHFGGKEGLYFAVFEEQFGKIAARFEQVLASQIEPAERLQGFIQALIATHQSNPYIRRMMFSELSNPTPIFEKIVKVEIGRIYQLVGKTLQEGIDQGKFRKNLHPQLATVAIAGMINFYFLAEPIIDELLPDAGDRDREFLATALTIFLEGMQNPSAH